MEKEKTEIELISLAEAAKKLNINKSKLHYYVGIGLIKPYKKMDATTIFIRQEINEKIKEIEKRKKQGYSLTGKKFKKYLDKKI